MNEQNSQARAHELLMKLVEAKLVPIVPNDPTTAADEQATYFMTLYAKLNAMYLKT